AASFLADEVFNRYANIVEVHFVHFATTVQGNDGRDGDAGAVHVDQQEADAGLVFFVRAAGAHQAENPVGVVTERGPRLGAVDDVLVTIAHGGGAQGGQVGARVRFRIALTPPDIAGENVRQEALLLFFAAVGVDHRRDHLHAEGHDFQHVLLGAFVGPDVLLCRGPAGAAVLDRPVGCGPALFIQNLLPLDPIFLFDMQAVFDFLLNMLGVLFFQKLPHFLLEGQFFFGKINVHVATPASDNREFK